MIEKLIWGASCGGGNTPVDATLTFFENFDPLTNDFQTNPIHFAALPFTGYADTTEATTDTTDPASCPGSEDHSVWYAFTSTENTRVKLDSVGSNYDTVISVLTKGKGRKTPEVACGTDQVAFDVDAGTAYLVMIGGQGGYLRLAATETAGARLAVDSAATVNRYTGVATIKGTLDVNSDVSYCSISASLSQRVNRTQVVQGSNSGYWDGASCSPLSPLSWTLSIGGNGPFNACKALATVQANVCFTNGECINAPVNPAEVEVRLSNQ